MSILLNFVIVSVVLLITFNGPKEVGCTGHQDAAVKGHQDAAINALIATINKGDIEGDACNYKKECINGVISLCEGHERQCKHLEGFSKVIIKYAKYDKTENIYAKEFLKYKDQVYSMNIVKPQFKHLDKEELLTDFFYDYIYGVHKPDDSLLDTVGAKSYVAEMYCQHQMCRYELTKVMNKKCEGQDINLQKYIKCIFLNISMSVVDTPLGKYYITYLFMAIVLSDRIPMPTKFCRDEYSDPDDTIVVDAQGHTKITNHPEYNYCREQIIQHAKIGKTIEEIVKNIYFNWSYDRVNATEFDSYGQFIHRYMNELSESYEVEKEKLKYGFTIKEFCEKIKLI